MSEYIDGEAMVASRAPRIRKRVTLLRGPDGRVVQVIAYGFDVSDETRDRLLSLVEHQVVQFADDIDVEVIG